MTGKKTRHETESQSERFKETARELGVELDEDKLKEALRRMRTQPGEGAEGRRKPNRFVGAHQFAVTDRESPA